MNIYHANGPSGIADVDTLNIQTALDNATKNPPGCVVLSTGEYLISKTLLIGSYTKFTSSPGTKIKNAGV